MRAAILKSFGTPLVVEEVDDPVLGTGEVIVDIAAAGVLPYLREVYSGARQYLLNTPLVPGSGGVGRIRAVGPDATRLKVGDWVFCDPTIRSRDAVTAPDILLQGLTAGGPGGLVLQRHHRDGAFAQQMRTATENVHPLGPIEAEAAAKWCQLGTFLVPYGGLLAIDLKAGETLVVNGATGRFGAAAVAVALAMGAARVVATGRNRAALDDLARRHGPRVALAPMTGDDAEDQARIRAAAAGAIDCVFDILPPMATPAQVRTAALTVRPNGRIVLMGGVGMQDGAELALPHSWLMRNNITVRGQWMYPREAPARLVALIRAGVLDLGQTEITQFPLDAINAGVAHAADHAGPFRMTVICP